MPAYSYELFLFCFQIVIMADDQGSDAEPDEQLAREAFVRAEIDARRRAVEERRLERLADEFRLEDESVPAITGVHRLHCVQSFPFPFLSYALMYTY